MRISLAAAGMAGFTFLASLAMAHPPGQGAHPPQSAGAAQPKQEARGGEAPRNLQVLPRDMPREQVIGVMQGFTQALGVNCAHCHEGRNFASDANPHKDAARGMMRMTARINGELLPAIPALHSPRVTCFTCHRGTPRPASAEGVAPPAHHEPAPHSH